MVVAYIVEDGTTEAIFFAEEVADNEYECYMLKDFDETPRVKVLHDPADGRVGLVATGLNALRYSGYYAT